MRYAEAFQSLGYSLDTPRQDWTAEKADGVCITIWKEERSVSEGLPYLDLFELYPEGDANWTRKPGHKKRTRHLKRALEEFQGRVDVIFVTGDPEKGTVKSAAPWDPIKRKGFTWVISRFDPETGFFRAEIDQSAS